MEVLMKKLFFFLLLAVSTQLSAQTGVVASHRGPRHGTGTVTTSATTVVRGGITPSGHASGNVGVNSGAPAANTGTNGGNIGVNAGNTGGPTCSTPPPCGVITTAPGCNTTYTYNGGTSCGSSVYAGSYFAYSRCAVRTSEKRIIYKAHRNGKFQWRIVQRKFLVGGYYVRELGQVRFVPGHEEWRTIKKRKVALDFKD
jgi:hypothetical protein